MPQSLANSEFNKINAPEAFRFLDSWLEFGTTTTVQPYGPGAAIEAPVLAIFAKLSCCDHHGGNTATDWDPTEPAFFVTKRPTLKMAAVKSRPTAGRYVINLVEFSGIKSFTKDVISNAHTCLKNSRKSRFNLCLQFSEN